MEPPSCLAWMANGWWDDGKVIYNYRKNDLADNGLTVPLPVCPICNLFLGWSHVNPNLKL